MCSMPPPTIWQRSIPCRFNLQFPLLWPALIIQAIYTRPSTLPGDPKHLEPSNPYSSVTVQGNPQRTFNSQVSVQPIVILNFMLETIPMEGSTADLITQTLRQYHTSNPTNLQHIGIKFNLQLENIAEYRKVMNSRLSDLDRWYFLLRYNKVSLH